NCDFPVWIPSDVFWTKRNEEQIRNGYIPLPNIHLLPRRYWYLYPKIFQKHSRKDFTKSGKDYSGMATPSSGRATRGSSNRANDWETYDTEVPMRHIRIDDDALIANRANDWETYDTEMPMRHIRIDDDALIAVDSSELLEMQPAAVPAEQSSYKQMRRQSLETVHLTMIWQRRKILLEPWDSSAEEVSKELDDGSDMQEESEDELVEKLMMEELMPELAREKELGDGRSESSLTAETAAPNQRKSRKRSSFPRKPDLATEESEDELVEKLMMEELMPELAREKELGDGQSESGLTPETAVLNQRKSRKRSSFPRKPDLATVASTLMSDRINLVIPAANNTPKTALHSIERIADLNGYVEMFSDEISALLKEMVVSVALQVDYVEKQQPASLSDSKRAAPIPSSAKAISLKEAQKDFGDLTLEEFLRGMNQLEFSSTIPAKRKRRGPPAAAAAAATVTQDAENTEPAPADSSEDAKTPIRRRRQSSQDQSSSSRPPSQQKKPQVDEQCIAAVEQVLKQSILHASGKAPEENVLPPRINLL
ncbi:unnamed protein product, partial [Gongylonema pulchrum]|uniref:Myb-like domain-containing protein n=1 Tax=Gongylonema pulchrum TaxID=637853 RepID=A0A183EFH9_9BILA